MSHEEHQRTPADAWRDAIDRAIEARDPIIMNVQVTMVPVGIEGPTNSSFCPLCHHPHLDYDDENCVSCGCEGPKP